MKNIYYILLISFSSLSLNAQQDTVTLIVDQVSATAPFSQCVPMRAEGFNSIAGMQFAFLWDQDLLRFDSLNLLDLQGAAHRLYEPGVLLFSWSDPLALGISIPDDEPVMELCFTALSDFTPLLSVVVGPFQEFPVEVVNGDLQNLVVKTEDDIYGPVDQVDCDTETECLESIAVKYEGDTISLFPQDLVAGDFDNYLACNRITKDELYLVNLSEPDPVAAKSGLIHCGNLKDKMYFGLAVINEPGPTYWVNCIVQVLVENNSGETCINTSVGPADPSICNAVNKDAVGPETDLTHEDFLSLDIAPSVEYNYFFQDRWSYNTYQKESPYRLTCNDYNQSFSITSGLLIAPPESPGPTERIIIPAFCTHEIIINATDDVCDVMVGEGETLLTFNNLQDNPPVAPLLNGAPLRRISTTQYAIDNSNLSEGENIISIDQSLWLRESTVSTLDVVKMMQALREEEQFSGKSIIAADIDRSGSLTTKDVVFLRELILAVISTFPDGMNYIVDLSEDLSSLDYLQFDNTYKDFRFDNTLINDVESIELSLEMLGDVFNSKATQTKSDQQVGIIYDDEYVREGETVMKTLTFTNTNNSALISGIAIGLSSEDITIGDIRPVSRTASLMRYQQDQEERLSLIDLDATTDIQLQLEITAKRDGTLSSLLRLSDYNHEAVTTDDNTYKLLLQGISDNITTFSVYPNPATDYLTVEIPEESIGGVLTLRDVMGREVLRRDITSPIITLQLEEARATGLYIVTITHADHISVGRFYKE